MTNRSESRGSSEKDRSSDMKSGSSHSQWTTGGSQSDSKSDSKMKGSGSGSMSSDSPGDMKQSGQSPIEHTHAGNTGFGSGQISPQTHNAPSTGKSSGSGSSDRKSGSDRNTD